ncbi:MAG: lytic transglycosylase domain-containing protein [Micromonosporaceae bacterium]|nr:lytic transglycosylase domain-containing protein [Micromonosporaceae bacterium]
MRGSKNVGLAIALGFVVLVCGGSVAGGLVLLRQVSTNVSNPGAAAAPVVTVEDSPSDEPSPSLQLPPSPTRRPSPRPTRVAVPPPKKTKPPSCPSRKVGTAQSRSAVKSALTTAARLHLWSADTKVDLSVTLVEAVAWQESGWQSNLVSCVGAVGVMQVTQDTAAWMNQRFGQSFDLHTLSGNAGVGSAQLQWLTKYFGDNYFGGNYDLTRVDPTKPTLLDAVLAGYNLGFGAVDVNGTLTIPNRAYVNAVERWMSEQPWNA